MSRASGSERGEAVELGDHEHVAGAAGGQRLAQPGSRAVGAGEAVVDVDAIGLGAERFERVALGGELLALSRHPGIADLQRHAHDDALCLSRMTSLCAKSNRTGLPGHLSPSAVERQPVSPGRPVDGRLVGRAPAGVPWLVPLAGPLSIGPASAGVLRGAASTIWVMKAAIACWAGIKFTELERQALKRMRYEGNEQTIPQEVSAA